MENHRRTADPGTPFDKSTDAFAALNQVRAQSVRKRLSETGSYFGVRPVKLINGRLAWPAVQVSK